MSTRQPRRGAGAAERARPRAGRGERFVAVVERRGRFLTARRAFPAERSREPHGLRASSQLVLGRSSAARGAAAREGDLVFVQAPGRGSGARVLRVLGRPEIARDAIEGLLLDRGLERGFREAVEHEAREAAERPTQRGSARRDLRDLATFTIDPASARDFDDALSATETDEGHARVWVHIADVAAHVREGGAVDREARRRGTSVYVPGTVEPMLPHALSSQACSLMPGEDRLAVTVEMEIEDGRVAKSAFYPSLIRSDARLDYEQVDRIFAGEDRAQDAWGQPLAVARAAAAGLQRRRERAGALVVDSEEPEFVFDERGVVTAIHSREQTESHRVIEHMMIAANEAVAALLSARGAPTLYRVHESPDPARVERLVDQLASLGVPTPPVPERMSSTQAAELLAEISQGIERYVARAGRGRTVFGALLLRSLKQAYYSPHNLGHAGLHSSSYCHFTSPIRRYPDLVCHRALLASLGADERAPRASELDELGVWTSEREREAMTIERDADDMGRCFMLEALLGEGSRERAFSGEITGLISAGAFVSFGPGAASPGTQLGRPFEGMVPVRMLRTGTGEGGRDWWELNEEGTILHGERSGSTLRLGDPLQVRVERVEPLRGRVDLSPAQ